MRISHSLVSGNRAFNRGVRMRRKRGTMLAAIALAGGAVLATPAAAMAATPHGNGNIHATGVQNPVPAVAGCQSQTGGDAGNSWSWAACDTSAPGIYFRAWIHCKH